MEDVWEEYLSQNSRSQIILKLEPTMMISLRELADRMGTDVETVAVSILEEFVSGN